MTKIVIREKRSVSLWIVILVFLVVVEERDQGRVARALFLRCKRVEPTTLVDRNEGSQWRAYDAHDPAFISATPGVDR